MAKRGFRSREVFRVIRWRRARRIAEATPETQSAFGGINVLSSRTPNAFGVRDLTSGEGAYKLSFVIISLGEVPHCVRDDTRFVCRKFAKPGRSADNFQWVRRSSKEIA